MKVINVTICGNLYGVYIGVYIGGYISTLYGGSVWCFIQVQLVIDGGGHEALHRQYDFGVALLQNNYGIGVTLLHLDWH